MEAPLDVIPSVLPSSILPRGFENLPTEIWEQILLNPKLTWQEVRKACASYPRVSQICQRRIWPLRQRQDFPNSIRDEPFYQNAFYNYLAAAVRDDNAKISRILIERKFREDGTSDEELEQAENLRIRQLTIAADAKSEILVLHLLRTNPIGFTFQDIEITSMVNFIQYYDEFIKMSTPSLLFGHRQAPSTGIIESKPENYPLWAKLSIQLNSLIRLFPPKGNSYFVAWYPERGSIEVNFFAQNASESRFYNPKWPDEVGLPKSLQTLLIAAGITSAAAADLFKLPKGLTFKPRPGWI